MQFYVGHSSFFETGDLKTRGFFNIVLENVKKLDTFSTFFVVARGADPDTTFQGLILRARTP